MRPLSLLCPCILTTASPLPLVKRWHILVLLVRCLNVSSNCMQRKRLRSRALSLSLRRHACSLFSVTARTRATENTHKAKLSVSSLSLCNLRTLSYSAERQQARVCVGNYSQRTACLYCHFFISRGHPHLVVRRALIFVRQHQHNEHVSPLPCVQPIDDYRSKVQIELPQRPSGERSEESGEGETDRRCQRFYSYQSRRPEGPSFARLCRAPRLGRVTDERNRRADVTSREAPQAHSAQKNGALRTWRRGGGDFGRAAQVKARD
jgi:hypothetical protein